MRVFASPLSKALLLVIFVSLLSGLAVSAAPVVSVESGRSLPDGLGCKTKPAGLSFEKSGQLQPNVACCDLQGKVAANTLSVKGNAVEGSDCLPVCDVLKVVQVGLKSKGTSIDGEDIPCPPETPSGGCGIAYTASAVVGSLPLDTQAYWAPGKPAAGVTVNAGTYWVNGIGVTDTGKEYYQIVVACQYLFVPVGSMQPNFVPPWSGQPLPTTPVN